MKLTICNCRAFPLCLAGLSAVLAAATPVRSQPADERLERVLEAWRQRQHSLKSVRYTVSGTTVLPKGSFTDPATGRPLPRPEPPEDVTQPEGYKLLLDFAGKRYRLDLTKQVYSSAYGRLGPRASTTVYDGKDAFTLRPRGGNSDAAIPWTSSDCDVMIGRNRDRGGPVLSGTIAAELGPLLFAHGLVTEGMQQPDFDMKLEAKDFFVHGQGMHEGRPCLVLRTFPHETFTETSYEEYWVDVERDAAIVRDSGYRNEKAFWDRQVTWQPTPHGWMPQRWICTAWAPNGRIRNVSRMEVVDFEADPAVTGDDFHVAIEPGMHVKETVIGKTGKPTDDMVKEFRIRADGGWNEIVNGVERPVRSWAPYWWGGALAVLVGLLALWHLRRRARRQPPPSAPPPPGLQML
jgi:hypothetical protein